MNALEMNLDRSSFEQVNLEKEMDTYLVRCLYLIWCLYFKLYSEFEKEQQANFEGLWTI